MNTSPSVNTASPVRITILTGDETIGKERIRQQLLKAVSDLYGTVTHERYDPSAESLALFLQRYITPSLFQETRVFHINHAQLLTDGDLDELAKSLSYEVPDAFLIVDLDGEKKGKDDSKAEKKLKIKQLAKSPAKYAVFECAKPPDYKLAQWLTVQVPQFFARSISKADAEYLVDLAGTDIDLLYSELQKIDIHLPQGAAITRARIEEITGPARRMTAFELASELGKRNFTRALQVIDSMFAGSFAAPLAVSALFRHFWALFRIRKFAETNPKEMQQFMASKGGFGNQAQNDAAYAIGRAAGLLAEGEQRKVYPVIIVSGIVDQARNFSERELTAILRMILDFDLGIKTGRYEAERGIVQMLCYRIVRSIELVGDGAAL